MIKAFLIRCGKCSPEAESAKRTKRKYIAQSKQRKSGNTMSFSLLAFFGAYSSKVVLSYRDNRDNREKEAAQCPFRWLLLQWRLLLRPKPYPPCYLLFSACSARNSPSFSFFLFVLLAYCVILQQPIGHLNTNTCYPEKKKPYQDGVIIP